MHDGQGQPLLRTSTIMPRNNTQHFCSLVQACSRSDPALSCYASYPIGLIGRNRMDERILCMVFKSGCIKLHRRRAIHKFGFSRPNTSIAQGIGGRTLSLLSPTRNIEYAFLVTNQCNKRIMATMPRSKPFLGP